MNDGKNRMTSMSDFPLASKSAPPLPPPIGRPVRQLFKNLFRTQELMMAGRDRRMKTQPALIRPSALFICTRKPRFTCIWPFSVNPWNPELKSCAPVRPDAPESWRPGTSCTLNTADRFQHLGTAEETRPLGLSFLTVSRNS